MRRFRFRGGRLEVAGELPYTWRLPEYPVGLDELLAAVEESQVGMTDIGFCLACGFEHVGGIEPDAEGYRCDSCGEDAVAGAEWILLLVVP